MENGLRRIYFRPHHHAGRSPKKAKVTGARQVLIGRSYPMSNQASYHVSLRPLNARVERLEACGRELASNPALHDARSNRSRRRPAVCPNCPSPAQTMSFSLPLPADLLPNPTQPLPLILCHLSGVHCHEAPIELSSSWPHSLSASSQPYRSFDRSHCCANLLLSRRKSFH